MFLTMSSPFRPLDLLFKNTEIDSMNSFIVKSTMVKLLNENGKKMSK